MFFPWTGMYPGGYGVYTQNAFQMMFGWHSSDAVGEKVLKMEQEIHNATPANWAMVFYVLLIVLALALAVAPLAMTRASLRLPPVLHQIWPWRSALIGLAVLLALLLLIFQLWRGFGLDRAVYSLVDRDFEKESAEAKTQEEKEIVEIKRGRKLGEFNLHHTLWFRLAALCQLAALGGVGLERWLERRGDRPLPRIEVHW
jgi:hypothetical protein